MNLTLSRGLYKYLFVKIFDLQRDSGTSLSVQVHITEQVSWDVDQAAVL